MGVRREGVFVVLEGIEGVEGPERAEVEGRRKGIGEGRSS